VGGGGLAFGVREILSICLPQVFSESEVRESVVFQLSKLVTLLLKACREVQGASDWDAMVAGAAARPIGCE
jgi:hypothetical protein